MKFRFSLIAACCFPLLLLSSCASTEQVSFFTEGNCPECEALIVASLASTEGVKTVRWDLESSQTTVVYHPGKTDPDQIQEAVAQAGFVTQLFPPDEAARAALPACCRQQIDRKLRQREGHE